VNLINIISILYYFLPLCHVLLALCKKITVKQQNSDKYRSFYAVRIRMLSVMRHKLSGIVPMGDDTGIPLAHQLMGH